MNQARFQAVGKPSEVLSEENLRELYGIDTRVLLFELDTHQMVHHVIPLGTTKNSDH
jgi:ABC-type hemin transport system ATPase subunit